MGCSGGRIIMEEIKIGSWVKYSQSVVKVPFSGGICVGGEVYAVVVDKLDNYIALTWKEDAKGEDGGDAVPVFKKCIVRTDFVELVCP